MKPQTADKLRKEKSPVLKIASSVHTKKVQPKKNAVKKQQPPMIKSKIGLNLAHNLAVNSISSKTSTGSISACQSLKQLHPALMSGKTSPKTSLADIKVAPIQKTLISQPKIKKLEMADRNKEEIKKSLANVIRVYYPQKKTCLDISMTEITKDATQKEQKIGKTDFNFAQVIGEGGYGKVWRVQHLKTKKLYAMKQMSKALIMMKKSVDNVLNERKLLEDLQSPFIANMTCAFNDRDNLYLLMDLLPGSDLRYRISCVNKFTEEQSKFLIACLITAVDYIHKKRIFHRDIKPQNLVFDDLGYLRLTDFGIARQQSSKQSLDASGTPGYMAPEVLCKQMHSFQVDFYAIGIICYELMLGKRPYSGNNRLEIRDSILSKQHSIKKSQIPPCWPVQAAQFINKLILRQPTARLGHKSGVKELKAHPWFAGFAWNDLEAKRIKSPFRQKQPAIQVTDRNEDYSQALMQYKLLQRAQNKVDAFSKYYFQLIQK